ncbi:MAG: AAA family ATPase [Deltaproteobacteria bacterium]|nr:AAA family ATPase [Deltaproteobacteria bacterium]
MEPLYLRDFKLTRDPFNVTPDPSFLYWSTSHKEAIAQLRYGIEARRGFVLLTGEIGTGKTTLIRALLQQLKSTTHSAFVFNTIVNPRDLLRYVCEDFGILNYDQAGKEIYDYLNLLNRFLLEVYRKGENAVLIIDEAQNLSSDVLESVRLLSNFETTEDKLIQIILVGQPELKTKLDLPVHRQLKQRIALRHHLGALSFADSREYMANRLQVAGGSISIFTSQALEALYACSRGVPRLINLLCEHALLNAYAAGKKQIDAAMVVEAARDLDVKVPQEYKNPDPEPLRAEKWQTKGANGPAKSDNPNRPDRGSGLEVAPVIPAAGGLLRGAVPQPFFEQMIGALTEAMGPMAPLVVEDRISALGESLEIFPKARLEELIESTSQEILHEPLKLHFQRVMSDEMRKLERFDQWQFGEEKNP